MQSMYQWLQERKGYTEAEASETVDRWCNMDALDIPKEIMKDIREYTEEYIQRYGNELPFKD